MSVISCVFRDAGVFFLSLFLGCTKYGVKMLICDDVHTKTLTLPDENVE